MILHREDVVDLTSDPECDVRNRMLYNPDEWKSVYLGKFIPCVKYELDDEEYAMVREMAHKFGMPMRDIIRLAICDYYGRVAGR